MTTPIRLQRLARPFALLALAVLFAGVSRRANAAGEIFGRVAGYIYDPTGEALSEVPLTISGSSLQQSVSRTTGDDGRYEFSNLPPGEDYSIEINVPGFTPIRQTGIKVRLGQTTSADVNLTVMTETTATATYQIIEKVNPVINPDSAQSVAIITAEKAAQTPIFHQVEGMAQQVAGVGPGNRPSTRGGLARHGRFYVDGMDTTDVTDGSITAPMNFDAVENFEIITGGMDAQYNSMGAITNVVTKNGGNEFKIDTSVTLNPTWMSAKPSFPGNNPAYFESYVNNATPGPQTSFYSPVLNFSGPLMKDKLWFYASYQQNFSDKESPVSVLGQSSNRPTVVTTTLGRVKLTWQATQADRISLGFNLDHNVINNSVGNASVTDSAEQRINRGGNFVIVNYDHSFTDSVLFQLQTGVTYKQSNTDPIASDYTTVGHFDLSQRINQFNGGTLGSGQGNYLHETKWRMQLDPSVSWKMKAAGTHQFKAGVQYSWLIDKQNTGVSGDQTYTDRGGVCDPNNLAGTASFCFTRTDYVGNTFENGRLTSNLGTRAYVSDIGAFIQDRWTINRQLTIIPGFRVDVGKLYGDNGALITNLSGVGPRLSLTYDVLGDRKSLITAHAGRSNDVGNIFIAQHGNPAIQSYTATFNTANNAFPNCVANPTGPGCTSAGGSSGRSIVFGSTAPHVDEVALGFHQEAAEETVLGIDLDYRYYGNMWTDQEVNRIWDASGSRVLGYVNGVSQSIIRSSTPDSAYRQYEGMDLWVQGTPGRWDLLASYTLAFNQGTVADYFDGYQTNPRMTQFFDGNTPDDRRHTVKGSVSYRTTFGLDLGIRLQYRTGSPLWESFSNPNDGSKNYKSPRGSGVPINSATNAPDFNDPSTFTQLRNPELFNIDLQARYNLGQLFHLKEQRLETILLVVNSLDNPNASSLFDSYTRTNNRFGYAQFHNSPLQAELLIRFRN